MHIQQLSILIAAMTTAIVATSCSDHDSPELAPIDTSSVKISTNVSVLPNDAWSWYETADELTVRVADVEINAPKGVVLRSVDLLANGIVIAQKPFAGETLDFKVPLDRFPAGRLNFSVIGNLIQKNARDAQILLADNLQQIIFSEMPDFDCIATVDITVKARSGSGEELNKSFNVSSHDHFTILVPQSELYQESADGKPSRLEVTMTASAEVFSTNTTLNAIADRVYWGASHSTTPAITVNIANKPGSLNAEKLGVTVQTVRDGTWEGINLKPTSLMYHFSLKETE